MWICFQAEASRSLKKNIHCLVCVFKKDGENPLFLIQKRKNKIIPQKVGTQVSVDRKKPKKQKEKK